MRDLIQLQCSDCKRRNYATTKSKKNTPDKIERKKYCPWCRHHTIHREVK